MRTTLDLVKMGQMQKIEPERIPEVSLATRLKCIGLVEDKSNVDYSLKERAVELRDLERILDEKNGHPVRFKLMKVLKVALTVGALVAGVLLGALIMPYWFQMGSLLLSVGTSAYLTMGLFNTFKADLFNPFDNPFKFFACAFIAGPFLPIYEIFSKKVDKRAEVLRTEVQENFSKYEFFFIKNGEELVKKLNGKLAEAKGSYSRQEYVDAIDEIEKGIKFFAK